MQVLIPAGGRGSRLWPLTAFIPKPLLPLGDRPVVQHLLDRLPDHLPATLILTPEMAGPFEAWLQAQDRPNVRLYTEPAAPAGSSGVSGAIGNCIRDLGLDDDIAVLVADSVQALPSLLHPVEHLWVGTFVVGSLEEARSFGVVARHQGWITAIEEKPQQPRSREVFTGATIVPRRLVPRLCELCEGGKGAEVGDLGRLLGELLSRGERAVPYSVPAPWLDLGTPSGYVAAHHALSTSLSAAAGNAYRRAGGTYVHPGATVENSDLSGSLVLAPASLLDCKLTRCIVLSPESVQGRSFERSVLCEGRVIPLPGWEALCHG